MTEPTPAIVLFTGDLRVHDQPALHAAVTNATAVAGVFVRDRSLPWSRPSVRYAGVSAAVDDLAASLRRRKIPLIICDGDPVVETIRVAQALRAPAIYLAADVTPRAGRRTARLRAELAKPVDGVGAAAHIRSRLVIVDGVMDVVPPGVISPANRDHYRQFGPYYRAWQNAPRRPMVTAPPASDLQAQEAVRLTTPSSVLGSGAGVIDVANLASPSSSMLPVVADETAARRRLRQWQRELVADYAERRDHLDADATSRLSAALHVGALSPRELADVSADRDAFVRQLAWRDFNRQIVASQPRVLVHGLYPHRRRWIEDDDGWAAWTDGQTGYPVVDAAMRQLAQTGWIHNRARMIVASFLTKHLGIHWQRGAQWFLRHLVDGDVVNNTMQWQWVAGVGTDTRPGRMFNPVIQSEKFDPHGRYIRRWVEELCDFEDGAIHDPWHRAPLMAGRCGYPPPIVEHHEARVRFRTLLR